MQAVGRISNITDSCVWCISSSKLCDAILMALPHSPAPQGYVQYLKNTSIKLLYLIGCATLTCFITWSIHTQRSQDDSGSFVHLKWDSKFLGVCIDIQYHFIGKCIQLLQTIPVSTNSKNSRHGEKDLGGRHFIQLNAAHSSLLGSCAWGQSTPDMQPLQTITIVT